MKSPAFTINLYRAVAIGVAMGALLAMAFSSTSFSISVVPGHGPFGLPSPAGLGFHLDGQWLKLFGEALCYLVASEFAGQGSSLEEPRRDTATPAVLRPRASAECETSQEVQG